MMYKLLYDLKTSIGMDHSPSLQRRRDFTICIQYDTVKMLKK